MQSINKRNTSRIGELTTVMTRGYEKTTTSPDSDEEKKKEEEFSRRALLSSFAVCLGANILAAVGLAHNKRENKSSSSPTSQENASGAQELGAPYENFLQKEETVGDGHMSYAERLQAGHEAVELVIATTNRLAPGSEEKQTSSDSSDSYVLRRPYKQGSKGGVVTGQEGIKFVVMKSPNGESVVEVTRTTSIDQGEGEVHSHTLSFFVPNSPQFGSNGYNEGYRKILNKLNRTPGVTLVGALHEQKRGGETVVRSVVSISPDSGKMTTSAYGTGTPKHKPEGQLYELFKGFGAMRKPRR